MQYHEFKDVLEAKRKVLHHRLVGIRDDLTEGRSSDFAEQATESENDDVLKNLEFEANAEIHQINEALQRLKTGDFGYCECCGNEIAHDRLNILPYTQYCVKCADKIQRMRS